MKILNSSGFKVINTLILIFRTITNPISAINVIHRNGDLVLVKFFSKKILFVCKPQWIEEVYRLEAKGVFNREFLYDAKKVVFGDSLVNSQHEVWLCQRRVMQPLFNKEAVSLWESSFVEESTALVERIKLGTADINLSHEFKQLIQRIFIRVLFGRSADEIDRADRLIESIDAISRGLAPLVVTELIGLGKLKWLFPFRVKRLKRGLRILKAFVDEEIARKKLNGIEETEAQSLISQMMQAKDPKTNYTIPDELLNDEAISLFFAGQDTTINTLLWFFYLIAKHDTIQADIIQEIKQHQSESITAENLSRLVYTKAALYEALRLYPSTAALSTQAVEPVTLGEQEVAPGTAILLSLYETHHSKKLWEHPDEFYPEHFLNPLLENRHKFAYFPFGGGAHHCIGRHFAELEMMIIIVTMLRQFSFQTKLSQVKIANSITIKPDREIWVSAAQH